MSWTNIDQDRTCPLRHQVKTIHDIISSMYSRTLMKWKPPFRMTQRRDLNNFNVWSILAKFLLPITAEEQYFYLPFNTTESDKTDTWMHLGTFTTAQTLHNLETTPCACGNHYLVFPLRLRSFCGGYQWWFIWFSLKSIYGIAKYSETCL